MFLNESNMLTNTVDSENPRITTCYSPARRAGNFVFISGQISNDSSSSIEMQVIECIDKIKNICIGNGGLLDHVVKLTVYINDIKHNDIVNGIMENFFNKPYPARSLVVVKELPKKTLIEIDAIMYIIDSNHHNKS